MAFPIASGRRVHQVTLQTPAAAAPDDDGSFTQTPPTTLATVRANITRAGVRQLERVTSGTVLAQATHLVTIPYIPGVTTQTNIVFGSRTFHVQDVVNPDERSRELQLICIEVQP